MGAGAFNRFDKITPRERLAQVARTPGLDRGRLVCLAIVTGDVDDGDGSALVSQPAPQGNTRLAVQVDIQNEAACLVETAMTKQRTCGIEKKRLKAVLPKQALNASAH